MDHLLKRPVIFIAFPGLKIEKLPPDGYQGHYVNSSEKLLIFDCVVSRTVLRVITGA